MRILLLTHAFNSLTQRLYVRAGRGGSRRSRSNSTSTTASPKRRSRCGGRNSSLRRSSSGAIPESVWRRYRCIVIHPGIAGDRGPSALDWAIAERRDRVGRDRARGERRDGRRRRLGRASPSRCATRRRAASTATRSPRRPSPRCRLRWRRIARGDDAGPLGAMPTRRCAAGRGRDAPGGSRASTGARRHGDGAAQDPRGRRRRRACAMTCWACGCHLYDAHPRRAACAASQRPGTVIAQRDGAILRATVDGAVWITHLARGRRRASVQAARRDGAGRPARRRARGPARAGRGRRLSDVAPDPLRGSGTRVGYLHFPFYNGAMGTAQCEALRDAYRAARDASDARASR